MKNKIAVVTAYNPRNCGMYSVDLSAKHFFDQLKVDYTIFRAQSKIHPLIDNGLKFQKLTSQKQFDDFSKIVYWGDFINNPIYGINDFSGREILWGKSNSLTESFEKWMHLFLLEGFDKHAKVYSISNNFQTLDSLTDQFDVNEIDRIKSNFASNFDFIAPRDRLSFRLIKNLIPEAHEIIHQGIDSAFLLDHENVYPSLRNQGKNSTFAYFFVRSDFSDVDVLVKSVEKSTGLRAVKINDWLSMNRLSYDITFFEALKAIKNASFVLTDTYHLAINSMNLGIPIVGFGLEAESQTNTCGDFKKKILFDEFSLGDFYIEAKSTKLNEKIDQVLKMISKIDDFAFSKIIEKKQSYRHTLIDHMLHPE
ncbi:MAG: polysaccharide pyruvyl transferase family protein [Limnohabitans sp.]